MGSSCRVVKLATNVLILLGFIYNRLKEHYLTECHWLLTEIPTQCPGADVRVVKDLRAQYSTSCQNKRLGIDLHNLILHHIVHFGIFDTVLCIS